MAEKHKVFISYHHSNDQKYKKKLLDLNTVHDFFIDVSVDTGDVDENLPDETIRQKIRDEYLKDSTVTILLVGTETKRRKHIDWELYSSMYNGKVNKQSGVLVILLPSAKSAHYTAAHGEKEKSELYPQNTSWTSVNQRSEYERRYPYLPDRIIYNLLNDKAKISVANWDDLCSSDWKLLINLTFDDRTECEYDLSRPMRRNNS